MPFLPCSSVLTNASEAICNLAYRKCCHLVIARTCPKQSIILYKFNFTMESLQTKFHIMDCHENFANFLAMAQR
ncbi:hypothetical protein [Helicobacter rodentium]|uniref:hypothetical protein n=1 Tax=Helicobacter rodentium TaxID=59617 RepID=UPI0025B74B58|nr:hypothetical protein [Helicobacter rodentium]